MCERKINSKSDRHQRRVPLRLVTEIPSKLLEKCKVLNDYSEISNAGMMYSWYVILDESFYFTLHRQHLYDNVYVCEQAHIDLPCYTQQHLGLLQDNALDGCFTFCENNYQMHVNCQKCDRSEGNI